MAERHLKVLLIEDNPGDVRLIREMLAEAKAVAFQLESANCLSAGLEQLAKAEVDLILLDLSLPDSLGLETFQKAYAQASGAPIVVLSGSDDEELAISAVQAGAQDYLVKDQVDSHLWSRAIQYAVERERGRVLCFASNSRWKLPRHLSRPPERLKPCFPSQVSRF